MADNTETTDAQGPLAAAGYEATLEAVVEALEGIASTFAGLGNVIPHDWIKTDFENIAKARAALEKAKAAS